jgi:hypothetical protein
MLHHRPIQHRLRRHPRADLLPRIPSNHLHIALLLIAIIQHVHPLRRSGQPRELMRHEALFKLDDLCGANDVLEEHLGEDGIGWEDWGSVVAVEGGEGVETSGTGGGEDGAGSGGGSDIAEHVGQKNT